MFRFRSPGWMHSCGVSAIAGHSLFLSLFLMILSAAEMVSATQFGTAPVGWDHFRWGLVNDNTPELNRRLNVATKERGIKIDYRYRYLNGGVDSTSNAMTWLFTQWTDYVKQSDSLTGTRPSFVIYMMQEEQGNTGTKACAMDATRLEKFFGSIRNTAIRCNGYSSTFVIEPDTWGYLMQEHYNWSWDGSKLDPTVIPSVVNQLGGDFSYLSDLPPTLGGVAQGIVRTLRKYAPDSYCGFLASHWSVNTPGWNPDGLVWSQDSLIKNSAAMNVYFFNKLMGDGADRPDFIGVEKNGYSAGKWKSLDATKDYWYWGDPQMKNYLTWTKQIAQGLDMPVVGWQISIGHMGLPNASADGTNTNSAFEDTYFPYFFDHVAEFIDAGFIGFLVGKGLADCTDYGTGPTEGDGGWFLDKLANFDAVERPWVDPLMKGDVGVVNVNAMVGKSISVVRSTEGFRLSGLKDRVLNVYDMRGVRIGNVQVGTDGNAFVKRSFLPDGVFILRGESGWCVRIQNYK